MYKRSIILVMLIALLASGAAALDFDQKQFYGQGVLAMPIGDWSDFANFGFGAGVGMTVPHSPELAFRGEISYITYSTEDVVGADYSFSMIPVNVLAHYTMESMYLLGGLGLVFAKSEVEFDDDDGGFFSGSVSNTENELGLIVGAGFELSPKMTLEGRFNLISDANFISANIGYRF
jgi:opacity protein-like surface antigen